MSAGKLSPQQLRFVQEYLVDLNATQAAVRAGYSEKTAKQQGSRLLTNVDIAAAVAAQQEKRAEKTEITANMVLEELAMLAFYDPADVATLTDDNGEPLRISGPEQIAKLPKHIRKAIVGWGWDRAGNFTLRFAPKPATLQLIGQHLGMFREQVDITVTDGIASQIEAARRRVSERQGQRLN